MGGAPFGGGSFRGSIFSNKTMNYQKMKESTGKKDHNALFLLKFLSWLLRTLFFFFTILPNFYCFAAILTKNLKTIGFFTGFLLILSRKSALKCRQSYINGFTHWLTCDSKDIFKKYPPPKKKSIFFLGWRGIFFG